ncbi:adenine phosphoribosyltransferase [Formosimonas limnophila]|uniref:Adenine phosphoribosyltransferase n=1 Tax=Formosimonas limnophila TaxID=1384487 RepID=A0A8J3CJI6_9BURK|nr:adenine phosphoribosyltransferase [Formosimonas limnophila]GHA64825.1 adenine phosphoribosyltransferase [Formosimonas limnophila]
MTDILSLIRQVPNYPKEGILFYDITTALEDPIGLKTIMDTFIAQFKDQKIDKVIGTEARGFIFAPTLAYALGAGFVPVRKPNKLPSVTIGVNYALEYGTDRLEIHADAIQAGERVLIVDDLLATGGTAHAVTQLVSQLGGETVGFGFLLELDGLGGREKLAGFDCYSMITVPA